MLKDIFSVKKPMIGMVHLSALPGTETYEGKSLQELTQEAIEDACVLDEAGFDAVLFQNTHDVPGLTKVNPETVAYMSAIGNEIKKHIHIPLGVNIHKVDASATLAVASVLDSPFVRLKVYAGSVMDAEGIVSGCAKEALAYRRRMNMNCQIWADVYDITSWPLTDQPIGEMAHWALKFGNADSLVITGRCFDETIDRAKQVRKARPDADIIFGGGINHDNVLTALEYCDGIVIGSALESARFTRPISIEKAKSFMNIVNDYRAKL